MVLPERRFLQTRCTRLIQARICFFSEKYTCSPTTTTIKPRLPHVLPHNCVHILAHEAWDEGTRQTRCQAKQLDAISSRQKTHIRRFIFTSLHLFTHVRRLMPPTHDAATQQHPPTHLCFYEMFRDETSSGVARRVGVAPQESAAFLSAAAGGTWSE